MSDSTPFTALIAEIDGVLTDTALHQEQAWRLLFDDYLQNRPRAKGEDHSAFTTRDYESFIAGKPGEEAIRDFLFSRGILMPRGAPDDALAVDSICGLDNRKDEILGRLQAGENARAFPDALAALRRWRRGGLKLGAISTDHGGRRQLRAAGILDDFAAVVVGPPEIAAGLTGESASIAAAMRQLGVAAHRTVLLASTNTGVRAGREVGCGLVVGVHRGEESRAAPLREAGVDTVVRDLTRLSFLRRLPAALDHLAELETLVAGRPVVAFLDFDGTLSAIVEDPAAATISPSMREAVAALARSAAVAIVSGRHRQDVEQRAQLSDVHYAGSHGLDIAGPVHRHVHPEAAAAVPSVDRAESVLREGLADVPGVVFERKPFSLAVHYRQVSADAVPRVEAAVATALAQFDDLRDSPGKKVHELRPDIAWDKGHAVTWLLDALEIDSERAFVLYIGDDITDEDAFAAVAELGIGLRVGDPCADTRADYHLADPEAVERFIRWLIETGKDAHGSAHR